MIVKKLLKSGARTLLGGGIAYLGAQAALNPGQRPEVAKKTLDQIRGVVPLPFDDETAVRLNGAAQALFGATLSLGLLPRVSALGLAATLVPTTLAGHSFWEKDADARPGDIVQFSKNAAIIGGLLFIVAGDKKVVKKVKK
ncbi:DoxX family protein [Brevibacterium sp. 50QC2O2]|jgi:putative oxidoreductase|uniref:DoxX family membrane protein n=1 Tax=Brevibacterium TaxID=1696 RepID=UPI00211C06C8|nr:MULTISPECIES: DoxX family protein [unclassified Brevibacterium]MCQ9367995.1 DoxX family protein [Brevibacterium sp. 91QC2O2]MCQ9387009.1 DoxX family protein [Brevibacterium sp. 68QC2CO]MCQ9388701.1 DoxX family protein [Brevibacterium sp. 50QC2O2]